VGICPQRQFHSQFPRPIGVDILQVKPAGHGVDFQGFVMPGGGSEDGFKVNRYRLSLTQEAAGGVGNDIDIRIFYGSQNASGYLLFALIHA